MNENAKATALSVCRLLGDVSNGRPYIGRLLAELALTRFDRAVQTVNGILFDGDVCDETMAEVLDFVFQSTAFGNNEAFYALNAVSHTVTPKARFAVWRKDYGWDRTAMERRYPRLAQHRWLYPFYGVHRAANGLAHKRTVLKETHAVMHTADRKQIKRVLKAAGIL